MFIIRIIIIKCNSMRLNAILMYHGNMNILKIYVEEFNCFHMIQFPLEYRSIIIRPEKMEDAPEMKRFSDALIDEKVLIARKEKRTLQEWTDQVKNGLKLMENHQATLLVAEQNKKIVGLAAIFRQGQKMDHFGDLGIMLAPDVRGVGLGSKLMDILLKWTREAIPEIECVELGVAPINTPAKALYTKMGFKTVAVLPKKIKHYGQYLDEEIMHLWL